MGFAVEAEVSAREGGTEERGYNGEVVCLACYTADGFAVVKRYVVAVKSQHTGQICRSPALLNI